jgi:hypothetical protein
MPYKWATDKIPMPAKYDKRKKLTEEQKEEIRALYGLVSQRNLAKMFNVSRRTIQFIGCPEKLKKNREARKKLEKKYGTWTKFYGTEYNRVNQLKHRRYKTKVLKKVKEEEQ